MRNLRWRVLAILLLSVAVASGVILATPHGHRQVPRFPDRIEPEAIGGFDQVVVFRDPELPKPPVLLLHEIPGLGDHTLWLAKELSDHFTVYVPVLFGKVGQPRTSGTWKGFSAYLFRSEWRPDPDLGGSRPISRRLARLAEEIAQRHPRQPVGIIGMCLTGSLPLTLLELEQIQAVVVAQPTLPFLAVTKAQRRALGISSEELELASQRIQAGKVRVLGLRFELDGTAKAAKHLRMKALWPDGFIDREICAEEYGVAEPPIPKDAHATLTMEWSPRLPENHPARVRRREVVEFLEAPGSFVGRSDCRELEPAKKSGPHS